MGQAWLLKFGIGGVQEFIGQARKARDLHASSTLISQIAAAAARTAEKWNPQPELVVPGRWPEKATTSWPHQFVVCLDAASEAQIVDLGTQLEVTARERWRELLHTNIKDFPKLASEVLKRDKTLSEKAVQQLDSALEVYWVVESYDPTAVSGHSDAYEKLSNAYETRRHTRDFLPLPEWERLRWTCDMCGVRTAVAGNIPLRDGGSESEYKPTSLLKKSERLCAVCTGLRKWSFTLPHFPSTHSFARDRFYRAPAFVELKKATNTTDKDWDKILEDLAIVDTTPPQAPALESEEAERLAAAAKKLKKDTQLFKILQGSSPYYAIVYTDGDEMGKWMSGSHFKSDIRGSMEQFQEAQQKSSEALFGFSEAVSELAKKFRARILYSGGDDTLLFIPLDFLLPLLQALREEWATTVEKVLDNLCEGSQRPPTLSMHAEIVHAKAPLQAAVAQVFHGLQTAKERERNSFSIAFRLASGGPVRIWGSWAHPDLEGLVRTVAAFSGLPWDTSREAKNYRLPTGLSYALLGASAPFFGVGVDGGNNVRNTDAWIRELDRQYARCGAGEGAEEVWDTIRSWLVDRREWRAQMDLPSRPGAETAWSRLDDALRMTAVLARELGGDAALG